MIIAVGVNADGRLEALGVDIGPRSTPRMRSTSGFCADVLFIARASDLVAKRGASAAIAARRPTNMLERLNGEISAAPTSSAYSQRPVGRLHPPRTDHEWAVQRAR